MPSPPSSLLPDFSGTPSAAGPGTGPGWERLAQELTGSVPPMEIDRLWVFRVVRREGRDFGTAILSRVDGERRRIYTARFVLTVKGKKRGAFEWELEEVGSGPLNALDELLALVPRRSDEEEPPAPVDPATWFPAEVDGAPALPG